MPPEQVIGRPVAHPAGEKRGAHDAGQRLPDVGRSGRVGISRIRNHWYSSERLRFLVVGAYNTAFGYGSFVLLYLLLGRSLHYLALLAISHVLSVTNAFAAHRWLTFKTHGSFWMQYFRFNLSNLGMIVLNMVLTAGLVEGLSWHPLAASAVTIPVTIVVSYVVHRAYSFRE
jgi:putative flippase GtrA